MEQPTWCQWTTINEQKQNEPSNSALLIHSCLHTIPYGRKRKADHSPRHAMTAYSIPGLSLHRSANLPTSARRTLGLLATPNATIAFNAPAMHDAASICSYQTKLCITIRLASINQSIANIGNDKQSKLSGTFQMNISATLLQCYCREHQPDQAKLSIPA